MSETAQDGLLCVFAPEACLTVSHVNLYMHTCELYVNMSVCACVSVKLQVCAHIYREKSQRRVGGWYTHRVGGIVTNMGIHPWDS